MFFILGYNYAAHNINEANFKVVLEAKEKEKQRTDQVVKVLNEDVHEKGRVFFCLLLWSCSICIPSHVNYVSVASETTITVMLIFCLTTLLEDSSLLLGDFYLLI